MAGRTNIFVYDNGNHVEEMLNMLEDEEEDTIQKDFSDDVDTDVDTEDEDNIETQNNNSDTEEDNTTKWYIAPGSKRQQSGPHNLIRNLTGGIERRGTRKIP
ncbi:hypothetical protein QE152_g15447 [Popillia japonica]|uniref:Uncharacterized protein n=1 Tax=Popillia japonica TaxID=7064 RepID=A0AAW1L769_POPJA